VEFRLKRIYQDPAPEDGWRVLVDGLWPRGVSKEQATLDQWLGDLSPSPDLRRWFGHDPSRWEEFRSAYRAELQQSERQDLLRKLRQTADPGPITLLYAARDPDHNHALVIKEALEQLDDTES
jgi:uncharacterized protein YeaO (DUF488 family)